jgi:ADP-ribosyl-[dinitrogen reductase] hydrolase
MGGDADSAGALAGMLGGAIYGAGTIPQAWLRKLDLEVATEIRWQVEALLEIGAGPA